MSYEYYPQIALRSLEPTSGPLHGGYSVIVKGMYVRNTAALSCRFGNSIPAPARWLSKSMLECKTPANSSPGVVFVQVSSNGVDFVNVTSHPFTFLAEASFFSIEPK